MYKVFEKVDNTTYVLKYESSDLDLATKFLQAYKSKYSSNTYVLYQFII